jgi:hypothetical protein
MRKRKKTNPCAVKIPGLPKRYQRVYEHVLKSAKESGRYKGREKEIAARTAWAAYHKGNPESIESDLRLVPESLEELVEKYEEFQGRLPEKIDETIAPPSAPQAVYQLGQLSRLVTTDYEFEFDPDARLTADENGQLYIVNVEPIEPNLDFGEIETVFYITKKPHLGDDEETEYYHHFGEEGGERPRLVSDSSGFLQIVGGTYEILPDGVHD